MAQPPPSAWRLSIGLLEVAPFLLHCCIIFSHVMWYSHCGGEGAVADGASMELTEGLQAGYLSTKSRPVAEQC